MLTTTSFSSALTTPHYPPQGMASPASRSDSLGAPKAGNSVLGFHAGAACFMPVRSVTELIDSGASPTSAHAALRAVGLVECGLSACARPRLPW